MFRQVIRYFSERCLVMHPVLRIHRGFKGELCMAEEAIGLAKSLSWTVEMGPNFLNPFKNEQTEAESEAVSSTALLPYKGRHIGPNNISIEGEHLKNWDRVEVAGTGMEGYYYNGTLVLDLDEEFSDSSSDDEGNEWTNPELRHNIAASSMIRIRRPTSHLFFGSGKVTYKQIQEISSYIIQQHITTLYINTIITPLQQRNIEKEINKLLEQQGKRKITIIDRFGIILRIFSERARSKISKLQLELAYLKYIRTRLVRGENNTMFGLMSLYGRGLNMENLKEMEIVSSKARGSSGSGKLSGEGETQLELERRLVNDREAKLRGEIKEIQDLQVRKVKDPSLKNNPTIAIIGYTNAGKTALMNYFTGANLVSENLLFQTLSTTARKLFLPSGTHGILLDTVGFISDLPHELIEAFKSTLEGVHTADILIHIRDISHPFTEVQKKSVFKVLEDINYPQEKFMKKYIEVWNKIDLVEEDIDFSNIDQSLYPIIPISAKYGINCDKLIQIIDKMGLSVLGKTIYKLKFPLEQFSERTNWLLEQTKVRPPEYTVDKNNVVYMEMYMDPGTYQRYLSAFEGKKKRYR
ncbi:hypothetical protein SteCoe_30379 [Stentor coeruleus]|uniref:Hflx-type G domain-containing protein n=1 Tax=Stentor coeruleus TaxID=5963 RepID=A0A1R2B3U6_9CILI|nr:hypothetical protein SteCoe_30379 [Stentor coeruleus]